VKYVKTNQVLKVWVTGGSEVSAIFHKIHKELLFPLPLWANLSHSNHKAKVMENGAAGRFALLFCFVHKHAKKFLKTYPESSFPSHSNDTSFSSLGLSSAKQSSFKATNNNLIGFCWLRVPDSSSQIVFTSSNTKCSIAQH
jgi:hypothetical protein